MIRKSSVEELHEGSTLLPSEPLELQLEVEKKTHPRAKGDRRIIPGVVAFVLLMFGVSWTWNSTQGASNSHKTQTRESAAAEATTLNTLYGADGCDGPDSDCCAEWRHNVCEEDTELFDGEDSDDERNPCIFYDGCPAVSEAKCEQPEEVDTLPFSGCPVGDTPPLLPIDLSTEEIISRTVQFGCEERSYSLQLPKDLQVAAPTPLVIWLHGWGLTGAEYYDGREWGDSFVAAGNEFGVISVFPDAAVYGASGAKCSAWNGGGIGCCNFGLNPQANWARCTDDVGFLRHVINEISSQLCVDPTRIYIGGFSNGGVMAWEVAVSALAERLAAVIPMGASTTPGYISTQGLRGSGGLEPLPIMVVSGLCDNTIPWTGSTASGSAFTYKHHCVAYEYADVRTELLPNAAVAAECSCRDLSCATPRPHRHHNHCINTAGREYPVTCSHFGECETGKDEHLVFCSYLGDHYANVQCLPWIALDWMLTHRRHHIFCPATADAPARQVATTGGIQHGICDIAKIADIDEGR